VLFLVSLFVDGVLAGVVYALSALAFVLVYKASRMINFALGEWLMFGAGLAGLGLHIVGLGVSGALMFAGAGMIALALAFNRIVLRRLVGQPLISLLMVTLGMGALMRGAAAIAFAGIGSGLPLSLPREPVAVRGVLLSVDKLLAGAIAALCIAAVGWFFQRTRIGLALRAVADDQQAAMGVGIDLNAYFALTWAMLGGLSVVAGTLWSLVSGGGFGVVLLGIKVFPIVIIGGLDSILGALIGAILVGVLESLAAGYVDPVVGGGFSIIASYLVLIAMLFMRPYGLFGRPDIARV
jgi:branched-chain amino acid transport system permease protein